MELAVMLKNRIIKAILPTTITSILSIISMTIPGIFVGAVFYSILRDTIPRGSTKPAIFEYIKHYVLYCLTGVIGWLIFILLVFKDLDFSGLYVPALFSIMYYHILLYINQYKD